MAGLLLLALASCLAPEKDGPAADRPEGLLTEDELQAVLTGLMIVNGQSDAAPFLSADERHERFIIYQQRVFAHHQTDSTTFYESYAYYLEQKDVMQVILQSVEDSLQRLPDINPNQRRKR